MKDGSSIHLRVLQYAHLEKNRLFQDFQISENGYDETQVEKSRQQYGSNVLSGRAKDTVMYRLRRAFVNPFTMILLFWQ